MQSLWVNKTNLSKAEWHETALPELGDGQVLLEIEKYALTANNITYAVVGDGFGYWNFFPTGDDAHGIVPVWGFAKVVQSRCADISEGERVYGYLPMASHLVVTPGGLSSGSFVDGAEHRAGLALVYNQYHRLGTDAGKHEEERALFQPLFTTSFLIEDMMRQADWFGADALVLTSASSKTALGLALVAKNLSPGIKRIGLTSPGNIAFVEQTGLYDQVLAYDDLGQAESGQPTVSVDFAGNSKLLSAIHSHWGDNLKYSCLVGVTHIDERSGAGDLEGPKPIMFFAPTAAQTLIEQVGPDQFRASVDKEFAAFIGAMKDHLGVEHHSGTGAIASSYLEMLGGKVAPSRGMICAFA
ncbi:DUF2855 family protein [Parasphingorhabdus halotolerans]|uniref:DUF2855 family protein n=2 Tax=Parasphingorhabdus halotolerans TaxID=2725558 RepID=A0A6H2DQ33_9SPHN|nr:DUF2855 family protein [Parasphingorhabdus halotolerans]